MNPEMSSGPGEKLLDEARAAYVSHRETLKTRVLLILAAASSLCCIRGDKFLDNSTLNIIAPMTLSVIALSKLMMYLLLFEDSGNVPIESSLVRVVHQVKL